MNFEKVLSHLKIGGRARRTVWPKGAGVTRCAIKDLSANVGLILEGTVKGVVSELCLAFTFVEDDLVQVRPGWLPSYQELFSDDWELL